MAQGVGLNTVFSFYVEKKGVDLVSYSAKNAAGLGDDITREKTHTHTHPKMAIKNVKRAALLTP